MKIEISKLKTSPFQGRLIRPENKKGTTDDQAARIQQLIKDFLNRQ